MSDPKTQLEDIICEGVAVDLYHVEEALSLDEFVGREAARINAATFGAFFGSLQIILGQFLVLQVARIFEQANSCYPIRSIPAAMDVLREHSDTLVIEQRPRLIQSLCQAGASPEQLQSLSDPELTHFIVDFFEQRMSNSDPEGVDNARTLCDLKIMRNKKIAHPEAIPLGQIPKATYADIDQLVALAKSFVDAVGFGYFSTVWYPSDAKRATTCLRRLLQKAGVVPDK